MQRHCAWLACLFLSVASVSAQGPKGQIPPRFEPLAKNERFRLLNVLGTPELHATYAQTSAFSADGKFAIFAEDLTSGTDDKVQLRSQLLLFDLQAKSWPREFDIVGKNVTALALSADGGKVLLTGLTLTGKVKKDDKKKETPETQAYLSLFDLNAGKAVHTVLTREEFISSVVLLPDGVTALACGMESVKRWDLKAGKEVDAYHGKGVPRAHSLALLNAKQFLAGYFDGDKNPAPGVLRWEFGKAKPFPFTTKADDYRNIWHLAVSRDGKRFAAGALQHAVSLWDAETGKHLSSLRAGQKGVDEVITAVALADDGKTVLSLWSKSEIAPDDFSGSRLIAWDGENNKTLWSKTVSYRGRPPILVQGEKLLIGGGPNLFETWNIKDGKLLASWGGHKGPVGAIASLPNGDILSAGPEGLLMIWRKGQVTAKLPAHQGPVTALALSRDRKQWLSAGNDKLVKLWSADKQKPTHELKGHTGPVTSLVFNKDSTWAATGAGDHNVKTWDLATGKEIASTFAHTEGVNAVAISPDELWIASASDDATIRLTPVNAGKLDPDRDVITLEGHKKSVMCLAFSPDGKTLLSGSQDQTVKVWDWAKEKTLRTIPGHKNWVTSIEFVDADTILTTSDDLSVCMWEVGSGKEIGRIDFGALSDCPRCLTRMGPDRILVGTSSWLIYEFQMLPPVKSKGAKGSSNR